MRPAPRRLSSLLLGVALATTAFAGPVGAQDETSEPTESLAPAECSLLTVDEVSTALGEAFTLVDGDGSSCQFDGDYPSGRFISLFLSVAQGTTRQEIVSFLCSSTESPAPDASTEPCGADVPVGSSTGAYIPEGFGTMLYVDTGTGDLLNLQLVGDPVEGVVKLDALTSLGALALPRLASLPQPEETAEVPDQTFLPDADLEALFPTEIGGTQLTIESRRGSDAFQDSDIPQEILDALATQGKTLDDMSVASGYAFNADGTFVLITAIRVMGGDAAAFADTFVSVFNDGAAPAEQTQTQLSGKDVTVVRPTTDSTDDQLQYVYPKDDVVWVVSAAEPALSEAFSKLPMTLTVEDVVERASADDIRLVRFEYCDPAGVIRAKNVHVARLASRMREGIGLTRAQNTVNMLDLLTPRLEGMEPVGEVRITPDPDTYTVLPWVPRTASMLSDQLGHDGLDWGCCPRSYLKRAIAAAADAGIMVQASFENEFYLFEEREGGEVTPWQDGPCYSSAGLDRGAAVMGDIVDALVDQGIEVEQAINEYGPGQQEIAVRYRDALGAADQQIKFRDTVRGVAETMHGLIASFAPKPLPDAIGSGAHVHFSLWSTDGRRNLLYDADAGDRLLSELGRSFVAGVLLHLPALVALTCPSHNSYDRLRPHSWAGSTVSWGPDNREASVRVASPFRGRESESTNVELKACDPSCNPYLALGGLITAGLDGVRRNLQPPEPALHDPATLTGDEARRAGIRPLPATMRDGLAALDGDEVVYGSLGDLLGRCIIAVRTSEADAFEAMSPDEARRAHLRVF